MHTLTPPQTEAVQGAAAKGKLTTLIVGEETKVTSMYVGEETKFTTMALGEEGCGGPIVTTMALGEEGGGVTPAGAGTTALGSF